MAHLVDLRKKKASEASQSRNVEIPVHHQSSVHSPSLAQITAPKKEKPKQLNWKASSFYYNPQKRYLALTTVALLFGSTAVLIFQQDALLAVFLALSSAVLLLYSNKKPEFTAVEINGIGVVLDDKTYFYKELKSFWLDYTPGGPKELSLEAKKWFVPYVKISIDNQNPIEIRSWLINFLPEKEHQNSVVDLLGRRLGL